MLTFSQVVKPFAKIKTQVKLTLDCVNLSMLP